MQSIFNLVYLIAFFGYLLITLFILYHVVRYSGNRAVMVFTVTFFLVGTIFLLITNALLFYSIPFDQFVPTLTMPSSYSPKTPF